VPTNLTLKGVPDEVDERLKQLATTNHRSLNGKFIARLEAQVFPCRNSAQDHLAAVKSQIRIGQLRGYGRANCATECDQST